MQEHVIFEAEGTRYDLVLVSDPYGGILVVWPQGRQFWRWHRGDQLKPLSRNNNDYDSINIYRHLEEI